MFGSIRRRFNATGVVAVLALVFAMSGGAYAASRYVITSTKQISPKVLKSLQGRAGRAGAAGVSGAQGPAGPVGPQGPAGAAGAAGVRGETGSKGPQGEPGKPGEQGPQGEPGPLLETSPAGKTFKGDWSAASFAGEELVDGVSRLCVDQYQLHLPVG
jgi:hypothetical protein